MHERCLDENLPELVRRVEDQLLPGLRILSADPHDPVRVQSLPQPWRALGCGNYAAVLNHPNHPDLVVKVYAPGRAGWAQEAEVYRRIGTHPSFTQCFHTGEGYLVLRRLDGTTFYDCLLQGIPIPPRAIADIDAALAYAVSRGLFGHDVHGRNVMVHQDRGLIADISDFLNPQPCRSWQDLRWAYRSIYRPLIAPLGLRVPGAVLDGVRRSYRLYGRLRAWGEGSVDSQVADHRHGCHLGEPLVPSTMPEPPSPTPGPEPLELPAGVHQLCSCGRSRHGWFCDGSHLGTGRVSYELVLSEPATVPLCRCGRSHHYPLCDGRHAAPIRRPWWRPWR